MNKPISGILRAPNSYKKRMIKNIENPYEEVLQISSLGQRNICQSKSSDKYQSRNQHSEMMDDTFERMLKLTPSLKNINHLAPIKTGKSYVIHTHMPIPQKYENPEDLMRFRTEPSSINDFELPGQVYQTPVRKLKTLAPRVHTYNAHYNEATQRQQKVIVTNFNSLQDQIQAKKSHVYLNKYLRPVSGRKFPQLSKSQNNQMIFQTKGIKRFPTSIQEKIERFSIKPMPIEVKMLFKDPIFNSQDNSTRKKRPCNTPVRKVTPFVNVQALSNQRQHQPLQTQKHSITNQKIHSNIINIQNSNVTSSQTRSKNYSPYDNTAYANESNVTLKQNYPIWVHTSPMKQQYAFGYKPQIQQTLPTYREQNHIPLKKVYKMKRQMNPYENLETIKSEPTVVFDKVKPEPHSIELEKVQSSFLSSFRPSHVINQDGQKGITIWDQSDETKEFKKIESMIYQIESEGFQVYKDMLSSDTRKQ